MRVNDIDRIAELGRDIEQAVLRVEHRAVGTHGPAEIDGGDDSARGNVNHVQRAAVRAGLADARVSVYRCKGQAAIR